MKKFKNQKGITLIALIITIILLLILAIVTISAVNEGNIFAHANNAATKYQEEAAKENALIANLLSDMEKYTGENPLIAQNKWLERGITNVQFGENKKYYCADTGLGDSVCLYLTTNGSMHTGETTTDEEFYEWSSDEIEGECDFTTPNKMQLNEDEYYIFNGNTISVRERLRDNVLHDYVLTLIES